MMDPEHWEKIDSLFAAALERAPGTRVEFLESACDDPSIREHVHRLLSIAESSSSFLKTGGALPAGPTGTGETEAKRTVQRSPAGPDESPVVRGYKLRRKIGAGGMGEVWEAEQLEPIRRRVALKLIKLGMDTRDVIARFESERQALAVMNHPAIAKVYDAGATDRGRPFFVMEYIAGIPVNEFADKRRLDMERRLRLFAQICRGIHHAHQKGIIHRDIKPSNVLVAAEGSESDTPTPKIIDFGIAKAVNQDLTDRTLYTALGRPIGTPAYMSPEQAEMSPLGVDTTTDVYSLGVLLYELVTGCLPIERDHFTGSDWRKFSEVISRVQPLPPSTRVGSLGEEGTQIAHFRNTLLPVLAGQLRGELDWIVMKAMEKDRTRRYSSAAEFAEDIERYLDGRPVVAAPPSTTYRVRKLIGRHRVAFGVAVFVLLLLIGNSILMTVQYNIVKRERDRANQEARIADHVSTFLVDLFRISDPNQSRGNTVTAREILDKGAAEIEEGLSNEPLVKARLTNTMGDVYANLGLYDQAEELLERALALRAEQGTDDLPYAMVTRDYARLLFNQGKYPESQEEYRRALAIVERELGPDHAEVGATLNNLGLALDRAGDYDEALAIFERALTIQEAALDPDDPKISFTLRNIGNLHWRSGRYDLARPLVARALRMNEKAMAPDDPMLARAYGDFAGLVYSQGDYAEARTYYEKAMAIFEKSLGGEHPHVALALNGIGNCYDKDEDYENAAASYRRAVAIQESALDENHPHLAMSLGNLAQAMQSEGRYDEALALCRRTFEIRVSALGPGHPETADTRFNIGTVYVDLGRMDEAREAMNDALNVYQEVYGPESERVGTTLHALARLDITEGDGDAAREKLERARAILEARLDPDHPAVGELRETLASIRVK